MTRASKTAANGPSAPLQDRARARSKGLEKRGVVPPAERIEAIMRKMAADEWDYAAVREHAEKFRVSRQVIERDAAEAGRALARTYAGTPEQRDEARGRLLARIRKHSTIALTAKSENRPDVGALARLDDIEAKIVGAYAPMRLEHGGEFGSASTAQLIADLLKTDPDLKKTLLALLTSEPKETTDATTSGDGNVEDGHSPEGLPRGG